MSTWCWFRLLNTMSNVKNQLLRCWFDIWLFQIRCRLFLHCVNLQKVMPWCMLSTLFISSWVKLLPCLELGLAYFRLLWFDSNHHSLRRGYSCMLFSCKNNIFSHKRFTFYHHLSNRRTPRFTRSNRWHWLSPSSWFCWTEETAHEGTSRSSCSYQYGQVKR